jgi:hypothetical protein
MHIICCVVRCLPQFVHQWLSTEDYEPAAHVRDLETAKGYHKCTCKATRSLHVERCSSHTLELLRACFVHQ